MNHSNPLLPQGSLLEQQSHNRPFLRIALFIVAIHMVFLGGLLIQGCKREDATPPTARNNTDTSPTLSPADLPIPWASAGASV